MPNTWLNQIMQYILRALSLSCHLYFQNQQQQSTLFVLFSFSYTEFYYTESEFPALNFTEFVMRNNPKTKTAKNEEMFQYIGVNNNCGGG